MNPERVQSTRSLIAVKGLNPVSHLAAKLFFNCPSPAGGGGMGLPVHVKERGQFEQPPGLADDVIPLQRRAGVNLVGLDVVVAQHSPVILQPLGGQLAGDQLPAASRG